MGFSCHILLDSFLYITQTAIKRVLIFVTPITIRLAFLFDSLCLEIFEVNKRVEWKTFICATYSLFILNLIDFDGADNTITLYCAIETST